MVGIDCFLVGFIFGIIITVIVAELWQDSYDYLRDFLERIILIIIYPFTFLFCFTRGIFHPVPLEKWNEVIVNNPKSGTKYFKIFKNVYFCYDSKAKRLCLKIFLVRVKE